MSHIIQVKGNIVTFVPVKDGGLLDNRSDRVKQVRLGAPLLMLEIPKGASPRLRKQIISQAEKKSTTSFISLADLQDWQSEIVSAAINEKGSRHA